LGEEEFADDAALEQVFLDDAFEVFWVGGVVPDAFGVDDGDWALETDAQAVRAGALNDVLRAGEAEFFEATFKKLPGGEARFAAAALGFTGICAQEDMPLVVLEREGADG
jgi:hypothetical protein